MKRVQTGMVQSNIRIDVDVDNGIRKVVKLRPDRYPDISTFVRTAVEGLLKKEMGELRAQGVNL